MISQKRFIYIDQTGRTQNCRKRQNEEAFKQTVKERTKKHKARARKKQEQVNKRLVIICYCNIGFGLASYIDNWSF
jgi:hypothetical protein